MPHGPLQGDEVTGKAAANRTTDWLQPVAIHGLVEHARGDGCEAHAIGGGGFHQRGIAKLGDDVRADAVGVEPAIQLMSPGRAARRQRGRKVLCELFCQRRSRAENDGRLAKQVI